MTDRPDEPAEPSVPAAPDQPAPVPLLEPRDGVPVPVTTSAALAAACTALAAGHGPVAVDAERASGYRYGQRAYLVQLRRAGAGTVLVDPIHFDDLRPLGAAIADAEWVLHAASQDLPCLRGEGMAPARIFDTELAGRLLGYPRVGLGAMVAEVLGLGLEKGHSSVDWSTRPLPEPWLRYAALDVEVLLELRDALAAELLAAGKLDWAVEEFDAVVRAVAPEPRAEPWRRTSGLHRVRRARQLAAVRALWQTRDRMARERDQAPGRVLPDTAIVDAALTSPRTVAELVALPVFAGRQTRRHADTWFAALEAARALPDDALPAATTPSEGPPPARSWPERDPAAATRLAAAREALTVIAEGHRLPSENLLTPDLVRRLCWAPPDVVSPDGVASFLRAGGAREWQVRLSAAALAAALGLMSLRAAP